MEATGFPPDVEFPIVTVTTLYPGASPETVERDVTRKIEESFNTVEGVKHVESSSQEGISNIVVTFNLEVSSEVASQDIRGKIASLRGDLPREIEESIVQRIFPAPTQTTSGSRTRFHKLDWLLLQVYSAGMWLLGGRVLEQSLPELSQATPGQLSAVAAISQNAISYFDVSSKYSAMHHPLGGPRLGSQGIQLLLEMRDIIAKPLAGPVLETDTTWTRGRFPP